MRAHRGSVKDTAASEEKGGVVTSLLSRTNFSEMYLAWTLSSSSFITAKRERWRVSLPP